MAQVTRNAIRGSEAYNFMAIVAIKPFLCQQPNEAGAVFKNASNGLLGKLS